MNRPFPHHPDLSALFPPVTSRREARQQLASLKAFCATPEEEAHVTGWLLLNPATVDRLCIASGLTAKGQVSAGVRALVASGRRYAENCTSDLDE